MTSDGAGQAPFDSYQAQRRFGSLDGLRFICILAVLWHHAPVWQTLETGGILSRGFVGVDFFFILSGYLITTLLLREEARDGAFSLKGFYWRRILRILPVYFFVVTLMAIYFIGIKGETQYLELLPFYYLFLSNFLTSDIPNLAPTWSLSVEEQYYMIWPLLLLLLPRRAILPMLGVLIALNVLGVMGAFEFLGVRPVTAGVLRFALPTATYAPILMGSVIAILLNAQKTYSILFRLFGARWACLPAFAALAFILSVAPPDLRGLPNLTMHLAMSVCLITLVIREDHVMAPMFGWRPIARVGEISYGIYLYHLLALYAVSTVVNVNEAPWAVFAIYALVAVGVAELSFRTLEAFFQRARPWVSA